MWESSTVEYDKSYQLDYRDPFRNAVLPFETESTLVHCRWESENEVKQTFVILIFTYLKNEALITMINPARLNCVAWYVNKTSPPEIITTTTKRVQC